MERLKSGSKMKITPAQALHLTGYQFMLIHWLKNVKTMIKHFVHIINVNRQGAKLQFQVDVAD